MIVRLWQIGKCRMFLLSFCLNFGIMMGTDIPDDLRDAKKSIPIGT